MQIFKRTPAYQVENTPTSLLVTIRPRKHWPAIVLTAVILIAFVLVFVPDLMVAVTQSSHPSSLEVAVAIIVFSLIFIAILSYTLDLLWQLKGQEWLEVDHKNFNLYHQIGNVRISRSCNINKIERFSILAPKSKHAQPGYFTTQEFLFLNFSYGRLELTYQNRSANHRKILRFGSALKDAEAQKLAAHIQKRLEAPKAVQEVKKGT